MVASLTGPGIEPAVEVHALDLESFGLRADASTPEQSWPGQKLTDFECVSKCIDLKYLNNYFAAGTVRSEQSIKK